jgi:hypothetical protein
MKNVPESVKPTDPSHEVDLGRVALWLDVEDLRWLASNCTCTDSTPDEMKERCGRVRFRANAALHKQVSRHFLAMTLRLNNPIKAEGCAAA